VVYGPLEQIASLMSVSLIPMPRAISQTPQGLGTHERRKKRNIWRLVLRNVEISLHSWSPPTVMSKEAAHASEAIHPR
jgi:hypothetical protein